MQPIVKMERFEYVDINGRRAACVLNVWESGGDRPIAMATELPDNPGMSITNAAEIVWRAVWEYLERPIDGMVMVEHYQTRPGHNSREVKDTFDLVTFRGPGRFSGPEWRRLHKSELEVMLDTDTP